VRLGRVLLGSGWEEATLHPIVLNTFTKCTRGTERIRRKGEVFVLHGEIWKRKYHATSKPTVSFQGLATCNSELRGASGLDIQKKNWPRL
jgi:hypothetical protein